MLYVVFAPHTLLSFKDRTRVASQGVIDENTLHLLCVSTAGGSFAAPEFAAAAANRDLFFAGGAAVAPGDGAEEDPGV